jgi:CDP-diacylglycerol--glycerol-3-phosphate 3-phosphatidyltransferase
MFEVFSRSVVRDRTQVTESVVNLPIKLTLARIFLVPLLMVFLISFSRVNALIAAGIFIAAALTDWLDGRIARKRNQVTTLGQLLDPVADKLLVAAALISLVQIDKLPAWMVVILIGREFAVTGLRGIAASVGIIVPASELAKYKAATQYFAITLLIIEKGMSPTPFFFHLIAYGAFWVALGLTLVSGIDYFVRFFKKADFHALVKEPEQWP